MSLRFLMATFKPLYEEQWEKCCQFEFWQYSSLSQLYKPASYLLISINLQLESWNISSIHKIRDKGLNKGNCCDLETHSVSGGSLEIKSSVPLAELGLALSKRKGTMKDNSCFPYSHKPCKQRRLTKFSSWGKIEILESEASDLLSPPPSPTPSQK